MRTIKLFVLIIILLWGESGMADDPAHVPVAAPIDSDSAGRGGDIAVQAVMRVICQKQNSAGTGFLHKSGKLITAEHVVRNCQDVMIVLANGTVVGGRVDAADSQHDLALVSPKSTIAASPLPISSKSDFSVGAQVSTWGFPSGYAGLVPMLSVGYLAGLDG